VCVALGRAPASGTASAQTRKR